MSSPAPTDAPAPVVSGDILVVDDTPANLDLLMGLLQAHGYAVRVAPSGRLGLQAARACPPDLLMLDLEMPDLDGYEVCRQLKADPATAGTPVLFISAHDSVIDKVRAFQAGGSDYVTKPFQFAEVLARVQHHLALRRLQHEMEAKNRELERRNRELVEGRRLLLESQRRATFLFTALSDALPGTVLEDRYRLEEKIGSGGFGVVFRARHLGLERPVAVKVFQPSAGNATPLGLERFRREGLSACRVQHGNAVAVLDTGATDAGIPYLVMELLSGPNLAEVLREKGTLAPLRCAEIVAPLCLALQAAHDAGIVHRDVKPQNVVLHREPGGVEVVKVVDFGLAKLLDGSDADLGVTASMAGFVGSPDYTAPEILRQEEYDGRADVYSVGVLLYQMLSARLPFGRPGGGFLAAALRRLSARPVPLQEVAPHVSDALAAVVASALATDPEERPRASEMARQLTEAMGGAGAP